MSKDENTFNVSIDDVSSGDFTSEELEYLERKDLPQRWYQWFSRTDTREEKVLIAKLDIGMVISISLFFC